MIETYKINTEKYHTCVGPTLDKGSTYITRRNDVRLQKSHGTSKYDLTKIRFSKRVVNTWNSLPNWIFLVILLNFQLDKFWQNQYYV